MLRKTHAPPCDGHLTSRDLVPHEAVKIIMPFVGTAFVWEVERHSKRVAWYSPPPLDLMAQGTPGGGVDSAVHRLKRTIAGDRFCERDLL
jgi:hypothetical protein